MMLRLCDESLNPLNASDSEHVISEVDVYSHSKHARVLFSSSYRKRERELAEHIALD